MATLDRFVESPGLEEVLQGVRRRSPSLPASKPRTKTGDSCGVVKLIVCEGNGELGDTCVECLCDRPNPGVVDDGAALGEERFESNVRTVKYAGPEGSRWGNLADEECARFRGCGCGHGHALKFPHMQVCRAMGPDDGWFAGIEPRG